MLEIFNNIEIKRSVRRLLVILGVLAVLSCILYTVQMEGIKKQVTSQSAALIGKVSTAYPELEQEIVGIVTHKAKQADIEAGYAVLSKHGYSDKTPYERHPVLKNVYGLGFIYIFSFFLVGAILFLIHTIWGYREIYRKVGEVSGAAERVVEGDFHVKLPSGNEGEFEILGHRFNQMADRLKNSIDQLVEEKVFLKNTISDISHQLKTPLSTLILNTEIMSKDAGMAQSTRETFLDTSKHQLERLEWLIHGLLKVARLEAGSVQFRYRAVSLYETVLEAVEFLEDMAKEAGVGVRLSDKQVDSNMDGDGEWLCEAFINIIKNCIEHSKRDGIVDIHVFSTALSVGVVIFDHGEGIDQRDMPHIFERFYKGVHCTKPNSIGIGLALSKAIIEGQGGSITVKSEKGKGAEFTVTFLKTIAK